MRRVVIVACLLAVSMALQAQTKADQIKHIREVYAQAKQKIANNGKGGKAPLDVRINQTDMGNPDAEYSPEEDTETQFYFSRIGGNSEQGITGKAMCYFISVNWMADGHTNYREFLYDPVKGHLLFSFMKAETHAGFKVETRYYYDAQGHCIEQKHKVQDQETTADAHSWSTWDGDLEMSKGKLGLFNLLVNTERPYDDLGSAHYPSPTPKAQRIKEIRATYAEAKQKIAKNDKADGVKNEIEVVVHDQESDDFPPVTTDLKYYYEHVYKSDHFQPCYFITESTQSMYGETYEEYLTDRDPESDNLIFIYSQADAEGEEVEMRYYYDDNGHCIEQKVSEIAEPEPVPARNKFGYLLSIYEKVTK